MSAPALERPQDRTSLVALPIMGIGPPQNRGFTAANTGAIAHNDLVGSAPLRAADAPSTRFAQNRVDAASQIFLPTEEKQRHRVPRSEPQRPSVSFSLSSSTWRSLSIDHEAKRVRKVWPSNGVALAGATLAWMLVSTRLPTDRLRRVKVRALTIEPSAILTIWGPVKSASLNLPALRRSCSTASGSTTSLAPLSTTKSADTVPFSSAGTISTPLWRRRLTVSVVIAAVAVDDADAAGGAAASPRRARPFCAEALPFAADSR